MKVSSPPLQRDAPSTSIRDRRSQQRLLGKYGLPVPLVADVSGAADARLDLSYAILVLSRTLSPLARAVFILRHSFDLSFDEIAEALGSTPAACRQAHSRARKLLERPPPDRDRTPDMGLLQRLVEHIGKGDVAALTRLLAEDVVLTTDGGGRGPALGRPIAGRERIAQLLALSPALLGEALVPRSA